MSGASRTTVLSFPIAIHSSSPTGTTIPSPRPLAPGPRPLGGRIVRGYCSRVDERALAATVASCKDLIDSRFPDDGDHGAAAMLLEDGTILTGTAPDAVNASVEVCTRSSPTAGPIA